MKMNKRETPNSEADWPSELQDEQELKDEQIVKSLKGEWLPTCPSGLHQRVQQRIKQLRSQSTRNRAMVGIGLLAGCLLCGTYLSGWKPNNQVVHVRTESPSERTQVTYAEFELLLDPPAFTVVRFVEVQQNALLESLDQEERKNAIN